MSYIKQCTFCQKNGSWLIDVDWVNKIQRRSRDQRKQVKGQTQKEREEEKRNERKTQTREEEGKNENKGRGC
jgi:hypothetical protein